MKISLQGIFFRPTNQLNFYVLEMEYVGQYRDQRILSLVQSQ